MQLDHAVRGLIDAFKAAGMPAIGSVSAQQMRDFQTATDRAMLPHSAKAFADIEAFISGVI
jgi:hypothetical protein